MTSKEALSALKDRVKYDFEYGDICYDYKEEIETIEKDLEVLEFLKQLFKGAKVLKNNGVDISNYVATLSESTNEALKDWLENDK